MTHPPITIGLRVLFAGREVEVVAVGRPPFPHYLRDRDCAHVAPVGGGRRRWTLLETFWRRYRAVPVGVDA